MASRKEESVRVCVRCRPLNRTELADGRSKIVQMDTKHGSVTLISPLVASERAAEPPKTFTFDQVYDEQTSQEAIYMQTASRIVDSVLEGFNGTIFAYGQVCQPARIFEVMSSAEPALRILARHRLALARRLPWKELKSHQSCSGSFLAPFIRSLT